MFCGAVRIVSAIRMGPKETLTLRQFCRRFILSILLIIRIWFAPVLWWNPVVAAGRAPAVGIVGV